MPKQNQPKYTNKSVSHHNIGFNIKRPIAIELDKEIKKIREFLQKERREDYAKKVSDKILSNEKNWYVPKKSATRGHVLEEVIAFYIKNKSL
jgi:hypothetical protein